MRIDQPAEQYYRRTAGRRETPRFAYARRRSICRRMISSRGAIAVVIAIGAALCAVGGLATAQSSPSAAKPPVGLSPKKINFGKVPAGTPIQRIVTLTNKGSVDLAAPVVNVTGTGFTLGTNGCTSTIPSLGTCPVSVTFMPPKKGKFKHGLLKFTDAGAKSPQKVKLSGVGLAAPSPTATPTSTASSTATATPTITVTATATLSPTTTASATATATRTATPTKTATATSTPTATPTPPLNVVFVTSQTYDGSINGADGLAGADAACASLASAAHLPTGTYKAWLSTSTVDAAIRLGSARGFVRVNGEPFADHVSDITAGTILGPIDLDELGNLHTEDGDGFVWTGTTNSGTIVSGKACQDWTSNSSMDSGETGIFDGGPAFWSDDAGAAVNCANTSQARLYCFDTSHTNPLVIPPVDGRIAFISKFDFDPSTGVSGADAECQSEATTAGFASPNTFLALISTTTASAATRFDLSMGSKPFVRPDGVKIADAPTIATGGVLDSGIWQYSDGTYFTNPGRNLTAWIGSTAPNVNGTLAQTCNDWSSKSSTDTGLFGSAITVSGWWAAGSNHCSSGSSVYCLNQQ
jgi:hypothetical protein